jgi:hypothetical protein
MIHYDQFDRIERLNSFIGARIMVLPDHPHANKSGTVVCPEKTGIGWAIRVHFDDNSECFVYEHRHIRLLD